jgi:hypothetical protein
MKQKSLLVTGLLIILALILFALVGCEPVRHTHSHRSYRPRTYVQFDHYWYGGRPYYQPRVIIIQPKQPRQSHRRGKY